MAKRTRAKKSEQANLATRDEVAAMAKRIGLKLTRKQLDNLYLAVPYMAAMSARLRRPRPWEDDAAGIFTFPREVLK
ncbi:MAG: hypothetical protein HY521_01465 [Proteobacteria bacterium]|nr:hypothetical protein [Pseudomonadota bacterium]